jgi:molybdenum cofactor biosynthesis enzyme MoaA
MIDSLGRNIEYLRLSLTDRCNLRCTYCRDASTTPSAQEISLAHIERVVSCLASLGITKVRLTGGEPLLRRDLEDCIKIISANTSIVDLCMTTNAHGLTRRADTLKKAGLMRINVSLDSMQKERFAKITGGGDVFQALEGIDAALDAGLFPVKVNCVVVKGKNDDEISSFIALAKAKPIHVRFIELMPMGGAKNDELRIANDSLLSRFPELVPVPPKNAEENGAAPAEQQEKNSAALRETSSAALRGTSSATQRGTSSVAWRGTNSAAQRGTSSAAQRGTSSVAWRGTNSVAQRGTSSVALEYSAPGFCGTVGLISPVTRPFCNACNRVRITHDAKLRPCLGDNAEIDLLPLLQKNDDEALRRSVEQAIFNKPKGHRFSEGFVSQRQMNRIGG